jgi:peptidoglycan/xylan/chitin deacetylase (PgdA/CDA1 family)
VRVDVSSLSSGAASWYFDPQPVDPAAPYAAGFYYRSGTDLALLATVTLSDGSSVNLQLPPALATARWTAYSTRISLPVNAVAATIYYKLSRAGWAELDDASLLPTATVPFARALASVTFDDGWLTDYTNALPVLQKHQLNATHYVITGLLGMPNRLSVDMLTAFQAGGDEIGSHTVDHQDLTTLSSSDLDDELSQSSQFLAANGFGQVQDFASPYGTYNGPALAAIETYYRSHRTVDVGFNTKGDLDPYRLKVQNISSTTTAAQVDAWAAQAAADRSWLILVYHDVVMDVAQGTSYSTTPTLLDAQLAALEAHGLPVLTIQKALDELLPQVQAP